MRLIYDNPIKFRTKIDLVFQVYYSKVEYSERQYSHLCFKLKDVWERHDIVKV